MPAGYILFWRKGPSSRSRSIAGAVTLGGAIPRCRERPAALRMELAYFSASSNGQIAYQGGAVAGQSQLAWYDRNGGRSRRSALRPTWPTALSHDEERLACGTFATLRAATATSGLRVRS